MVYIGERVKMVKRLYGYDVYKVHDGFGVCFEVVQGGVILMTFKRFGDAKKWCCWGH